MINIQIFQTEGLSVATLDVTSLNTQRDVALDQIHCPPAMECWNKRRCYILCESFSDTQQNLQICRSRYIPHTFLAMTFSFWTLTVWGTDFVFSCFPVFLGQAFHCSLHLLTSHTSSLCSALTGTLALKRDWSFERSAVNLRVDYNYPHYLFPYWPTAVDYSHRFHWI